MEDEALQRCAICIYLMPGYLSLFLSLLSCFYQRYDLNVHYNLFKSENLPSIPIRYSIQALCTFLFSHISTLRSLISSVPLNLIETSEWRKNIAVGSKKRGILRYELMAIDLRLRPY